MKGNRLCKFDVVSIDYVSLNAIISLASLIYIIKSSNMNFMSMIIRHLKKFLNIMKI